MDKAITARQVVDRIRAHCGVTWTTSELDVFEAGEADAPVTGIATSFTPSIAVLEAAVAKGKNLIITQQPAYYSETPDYLAGDPAFLYKKALIDKHGLVIWRFYDNWNARAANGQMLGLAKALGWDGYHVHARGGEPYGKGTNFFEMPAVPLRDKVAEIRMKLNIPGLRVIGDPGTIVKKAAVSQGMFSLKTLQDILQDPAVDLVVIDEAIEWESCEYFRDILTWKGRNKGMILLGREASEDPGYGEMAAWLKTFVSEVSVEWMPAGQPFHTP